MVERLGFAEYDGFPRSLAGDPGLVHENSYTTARRLRFVATPQSSSEIAYVPTRTLVAERQGVLTIAGHEEVLQGSRQKA